MTITEMALYFDILQDKFGSPYFTNSEKSSLLNRAQIIFVKDMLPSDENEINDINIETNADTVNSIEPLIVPLTPISGVSSGIISKSTVDSNLNSLITGANLWRILNIGYSVDNINYVPVKFVRHNDWYQFMDNYFKLPDYTNPKYTVTYSDYLFLPSGTFATLYFTVLKYPIKVDIDTVINCELPDFTHDKIVAIACELAGIGTRDEMLVALSKMKK